MSNITINGASVSVDSFQCTQTKTGCTYKATTTQRDSEPQSHAMLDAIEAIKAGDPLVIGFSIGGSQHTISACVVEAIDVVAVESTWAAITISGSAGPWQRG